MTGNTANGKGQKVSAKPALYAFLLLIVAAVVIALFFAISAAIQFGFSIKPPPAHDAPEQEIKLQPYAVAPAQKAVSDIPSSPARRHYASSLPGGTAARNAAGLGTATDAVPGTLPSGTLLSAVENGKTIFLPNPKGDCDVVRSAGESTTQKLDDCFAGKKSGR